jgi:transcriptional regulator with XRE-family HTH domain
MDFGRIGFGVRAVRLRMGIRQADVAERAHVSRRVVIDLERGASTEVTVAEIDAVCRVLGGNAEIVVRWHGTDFERVVNGGHAALHESVSKLLTQLGWEVAPEVSFSEFGERGVIDILAWHAPTRTVLVIELKTELADVSALMGQVDRYRRLARKLARDRGWDAASVSAWVAVAESRTNRRRLAEHSTALRAAFPNDGRTVPAWLKDPAGSMSALSFVRAVAVSTRIASRGSRRRVRLSRA